MNDVKSLYCTNPECAAKKIKAFTLFVSRDALNMDGLSEATLEKFLDRGFLHDFSDLFHLQKFEDEIIQMEGFGEKSFRNLIDSIDAARDTTLPRLIYGLGIANIGVANARMLCRYFDYDLERMRCAGAEELSAVEGVGEVIAAAFRDFFAAEKNQKVLERLLPELRLEKPETDGNAESLSGMNFVITGSLVHFPNRETLKEIIEAKGGKVTGSVTGKTRCLINNDVTSMSSKNKKAKELQIPIITEEDFMKEYLTEKNESGD